MSNRILISVLCFAAIAVAAAQPGSATPKQLPKLPEFAQCELVRLELPDRVEAEIDLVVRFAGMDRALLVRPYTMRSDDFRLLVQGADGKLVDQPAPAPRTFRGSARDYPDSVVAGNLIDGRLNAQIRIGSDTTYWIQPLIDFDPTADPKMHVVYQGCDVRKLGSYRCGADDIDQPDHRVWLKQLANFEANIQLTGDMICDVAIDADFEFYGRNGNSVPNTVNDIELVMNNVETIYENTVDISYEVTTIIVRTGEPDPYTSTNSSTLLGEFRSHWNTNLPFVRRDIAHLFTGKDIDSNIIGIAHLSTICASTSQGSGYGVSESRYTTNMTSRTCLTAHELGHNWSASHCNGDTDCYIMCSGLGGCAGNCTTFGTRSRNSITTFRNSRTCLTVEPAPIPLPFFDSFPTSSFDANKWVYVQGLTIAIASDFREPWRVRLDNPFTPNNALRNDDLRTHFILMGGAPSNTEASFLAQSQGCEPGDALIVDYWANNLRWVNIATIEPWTTGDSVRRYRFAFPTAGRHNEFRLRFGVNVNETNDIWYIDNVRVGPPMPGDITNDGCIDDTDLSILLDQFGMTGDRLLGDINQNGVVDDADLATVLAGFGQGCP